MRRLAIIISVMAAMALFLGASSVAALSGSFVGSEACSECHEDEYANFNTHAKKRHSGESVKLMASDLTETEVKECYGCHTTGYGKPGGFVSFEETPELGHAGCEVCHGPGYDHVDSGGDPDFIKRDLSLEECAACHDQDRVNQFDYKPLLHGGAH